MRIGDYLEEDRILLNLKARNKEEAIKETAVLLKNTEKMIDFESFLNTVIEREELATTGIGHEIAIPHARTDAVKDIVIAFGRSLEGIEFKSLDAEPVKIIFLMGTPKEKRANIYLKVLADLSRLLEKESFRKSLLKAVSPKEVIELFRKVER